MGNGKRLQLNEMKMLRRSLERYVVKVIDVAVRMFYIDVRYRFVVLVLSVFVAVQGQ
jgi:hypothetical protein